MKNFTLATAAAAALSAAVLGLAAPAAAAPAGAGSAHDAIGQLEEQGNRVVVNRLSSTPLSEASVVAVQPGPPVREYVWDAQGDRRVLETVGRVLFVDVR